MEQDKNNIFFFRFEDLRIYNKALDYVVLVHGYTRSFPENERHALAAKFLNAAESIAVNIAEGSGRNKTQFIYYLKMAKSSIRECLVTTTIAQKLKFISDESVEESRTQLIEMTKMVGALISSLQRTQKGPELVEEDDDDEMSFNKFTS